MAYEDFLEIEQNLATNRYNGCYISPKSEINLTESGLFFQFYNTLFTEDLLMIFFNFRTQHTYYFICVTVVIFRF